MAGRARTVLGDVPANTLGMTLVHEHLVVDWGELMGRPKVVDFELDAEADRMAAILDAAADDGIGALGECTPIGTGRYPDLMRAVAQRTRVKVIGATGFFHGSWTPMHPVARALDIDALDDLFTREITEGMGGTLIRAGLIKCATGEGRISDDEAKVLRAAARAHRRTGAPIVTHTTGGLGNEQLDLFASEGVGPEGIVISHVGTEPEPLASAEALLRRGATISVDEISYPFFPDEHWIAIVGHAVRQGFVRQVTISHDALMRSHGPDAFFGPGEPHDYGYIPRVFVPKLQAATGISDGDLAIILEENPQRLLGAF